MADWREQCHSFESMGAAGFSLLNLNGAGEPVALYGGTFSSDLLEGQSYGRIARRIAWDCSLLLGT